jgi:hypothetical protein
MFGFNAATALTKTGLFKLIPVATATGTAMTFALGPVGIAIAAIVAGVALLAVTLGGIKGNQMEKATKGVTTALKNGASASELWTNATLAVNDATKVAIDTIPEMKKTLDVLAKGGRSFATTALADSFEAMGRSLGNMAQDELPAAQASFKRFTTETKLSKEQIGAALNEMDDYKKVLIEQADQMAINIRTTDGQIDMQKLANFAIGEGEIAQRRANEETQKAVDKLSDQARGFVDFQGAIGKTNEATRKWAEAQAASTADATDTWEDYWDGQTFNVDVFLQQLEDQVKAASEWQSNIAKLTGKLPQAVLDELVSMGEAGAMLVASLTDGVNDEEEIARLGRVGTAAGDTLYKGAQAALDKRGPLLIKAGVASDHLKQLQNLFGRTPTVTVIPASPTRKDGGYIKGYSLGGPVTGLGTARSDSIPAMLSNGEFVINARATAQNRELLEKINNNESVPVSQSITINVAPSPGMDEKELAEIVSRKVAFAMTKGGY